MSAFRLGFRAFLRQPRLMSLLVLTLGLGIGANAAVFTVLNAVVLRPLPFAAPERLVRVFESNDIHPRMSVSNPNFLDWREQATSFEALAAFGGGPETVLGGREPVVADVYTVTGDFFRALGVRPAVGRTFQPEELRVGGVPAVVVSERFWRETLGAVAGLDRVAVRIGPYACRVVGVIPAGLIFPEDADVYLPKELDEDRSGRTGHNLRVIGRLRAGVSVDQAAAEMNAIAARLQAQHRGDNDAQRVAMVDLRDQLTSGVRSGLLLLQGVVLLVLLAACANVAGGLLTRAAERRKELAIRAAMGAGQARLMGQLLAESLVLAAVGGAVGLSLAWSGVRTLRALGPVWLPRLDELALDWRVLLFVAAVSCLAAIAFGVLPALQGTRVDLREALTADGRSSSPAMRGRTRHALVAVEVALALTLLLCSGLLLRSLVNVLSSEGGFDPHGVMTADLTLPGSRYADGPSGAAFFDRVLERLAAAPGVTAVGLTSALPLDGPGADGGFAIESRPELSAVDWQKGPVAGYRLASAGYFSTLGIPLVSGRVFSSADAASAPATAIVNQALVDRYFAGREPLGQRIRFLGMDLENPWLTIVGVVGNVRQRSLDTPPEPEVFVHYRQLPFRTRYGIVVVARAATDDASSLGPAVRAAVRGIDPEVPIALQGMDARVRASVGDRRLTVALVSVFTLIVFALSMVGVYGVVSHTVAARTQEIGIRVALGATSRSVVGLILRGASVGLAAGLVAGVVGAAIAAQALAGFLFGVTPADLVSYAGAVAVLCTTGLLAAWIPARRATRIDPVDALR